MNEWPDGVTVGPIRDWPGMLTSEWSRKPSPFGADLTSTLRQMRREVLALTETRAQEQSVEVLVAISPEQFRRDGKPRARATAVHPGVILSLDSVHGHLSYPCDRFSTWEANLRAIVLALEALRRVERYGVTRSGEQYRGFLAITSGGSDGVAAAVDLLAGIVHVTHDEAAADLRRALRYAKRAAHPDTGGSAEQWAEVARAEGVLSRAGMV